MLKLIIDNREKNVIRHADVLDKWGYTRAQLTVGDYVITYTGDDNVEKIFAVFERKSLEDYAASFKDGRSDNKNKLLQLRDDTNCKIFYIIEGTAFPKPNDTFGRIPFSHIQSSIFHLQVEHDIMIIQTKDTLHTAETLISFMKSMKTLAAKHPSCFKGLTTPASETVQGGTDDAKDQPIATVLDILTAPRGRTDNEILRSMWACFKYISVESASEYMYKFIIADLIRGKISRESLKTQKTSIGKSIPDRVVDSLLKHNSHRDIRLLSCIPGVSESTAKDIIKQHSLKTLLSYPAGAISIIKVGVNRRNLGEAKAGSILKYFNMSPQVSSDETNSETNSESNDNIMEKVTIDEAIAMNVMATLKAPLVATINDSPKTKQKLSPKASPKAPPKPAKTKPTKAQPKAPKAKAKAPKAPPKPAKAKAPKALAKTCPKTPKNKTTFSDET
jgi:ERCC4-type nuclease